MFAFAKNLVKSAEGIINPEEGGEEVPSGQEAGEPGFGFRVVHVDQSSTASEAGLESFFDFVIGLNGHDLDSYMPGGGETAGISVQAERAPPIESFLQEVGNCKGRSISLDVWSAKGRVTRTVMLMVSADADAETDSSFGLGMTLQWTPLSVADQVWHVLNVAKGSPAEKAGLISHADYIIGAENGLLAAGGETLLGRAVSRVVSQYYEDKRDGMPEIELYVYNHDYDVLRPVTIRPNPHWGGTGLLGCGVGYGLLHRIPAVAGKFDHEQRRRSSSVYRAESGSSSTLPPGGTLFEATSEEGADAPSYITPANLASAAPHVKQTGAGAAGAAAAKRRAHHASSFSGQNNDLSEYFKEEEQKSRELEGRSNQPTPDNIPPPPPAKK
ncbi:hypothetical protein TRICI_000585 [Trichomonascus ciferrii]|uniref:PDZ GRASP-type domain-containing protein n=1 Tax=Trichomonascus ciferrii TaxID=44093 RepID=A0A642VBW8_9ASCO|nr:hypothetical protein TRICI_000585 [Trichomonascus ciferrii]